MSSPYKPSPLSLNSPRASPFRRSGSPLPPRSPSTLRPSPSQSSPFKSTDDARPTPPTPGRLSPTKDNPFKRSTSSIRSNGDANNRPTTPVDRPVTPHEQTTPAPIATPGTGATDAPTLASPATSPFLQRKSIPKLDPTTSPTRPPIQRNITATTETTVRAPRSPEFARHSTRVVSGASSLYRGGGPDPLAHIPASLLHSMRESFSVLDRNNSGAISAGDVQEALAQVGLDNGPASLAPCFPPGAPGSLNLASYLNMMAGLLAPMSRESELLAAFEAFDDQDDGQIDVAELTEALLDTVPDKGEQPLTEREIERVVEAFRGRRSLAKKGKGGLGRGDVFRYKEFVGSVCGGGANKGAGAEAAA